MAAAKDSVGDGGYHQVPGCDDSRGTQDGAPISTTLVLVVTSVQ